MPNDVHMFGMLILTKDIGIVGCQLVNDLQGFPKLEHPIYRTDVISMPLGRERIFESIRRAGFMLSTESLEDLHALRSEIFVRSQTTDRQLLLIDHRRLLEPLGLNRHRDQWFRRY